MSLCGGVLVEGGGGEGVSVLVMGIWEISLAPPLVEAVPGGTWGHTQFPKLFRSVLSLLACP